jgi:hypothetical protein
MDATFQKGANMTVSIDDPLHTPAETAQRLRVDKQTLAKWRSERRRDRQRVMLPWIKIGGRVLYRKSDIEKFLSSRLHVPGEKRRKRSAS